MSRRKLNDRSARHDAFHKRAKQQGFRSRAVFKLGEVDDRFGLMKPGGRVLDLGCAPGSWLQYARGRVGAKGELVGIDRFPLDPPVPGARLIVGDIFDVGADELRGDTGGFDLVMSDMAPDTTGIRHVDQARSEVLFTRALDIAEEVLVNGGAFVGKLFQGPEFQDLVTRCRRDFDAVKIVKPEGSRSRSIEQYVVARGFRGGK